MKRLMKWTIKFKKVKTASVRCEKDSSSRQKIIKKRKHYYFKSNSIGIEKTKIYNENTNNSSKDPRKTTWDPKNKEKN